ncbi:hypothetical protein C8R43DRAFT_675494 [Mycena crocata]|nr:hypothetical protein C8R43DRAFT_675494 [Mycena crocata]
MPDPTCPALVPPHDHKCSLRINFLKGHKWCLRHHKAERRHHDSYKHYSDALDSFDNSDVCTDVEVVASCGSLETLGRWAARLRQKLTLYARVIRGRTYHHDRFHAGGDATHQYYIRLLTSQQQEHEGVLEAVNRRHDEISGIVFPDSEDVDEEEVAAILGCEDSATDANVPEEDPYADHFEEEQRRERSLLIQCFFAFRKTALLHGDDTRAQFIDYMERLVILAICERSGMRALLHPGAADVEAFLAQDLITLDELKQVYVAVHLMPPPKVLRAINDAFRGDEEEHDVVLGRRIYANEWYGADICLAAWDLFEDVMPCRHCALQGSSRLEDWTKIEQLSTLSLRFLNWQPENVANFSGADTLFHLSGVYQERKWKRKYRRAHRSPHVPGQWLEIEHPSGLYLKFPLSNTDIYHRFLHTIQSLPNVFSVLPWAPAFTEDSGTLIPKAQTTLCASRIRTAASAAELRTAEWRDGHALTETEARTLHDTSRDPGVLHMIVLDRTGSDVATLKNNLAAALLFARQVAVRTPRAFVAAEIRALFNAGAAGPGFGVGEAGLLAIAAGAIEVRGDNFKRFRTRCVTLVETLADAELVRRWTCRARKRKRKDAVDCWNKWRTRLDRMQCSKDFFYFGTEEGHMHLRERLGRTISPTEGAVVKYDEDVSREVFQRALDRSEAVEKMLPPRQIQLDWDGEIKYTEQMTDIFTFMREDFVEESQATIVEVDAEQTVTLRLE